MSNLLFNLRVGLVHFQIARDRPWLRVSVNDYHRGRVVSRAVPFVERYQ